MKIYEIITESMPNGSTFSYGPPGVNPAHPCVDPTDPTCPGHKAGLKYQFVHSDDNTIEDESNSPSFDNGREQAANMIAHNYQAISPNVRRAGKFISPNLGFKIADLPSNYKPEPKQDQQQFAEALKQVDSYLINNENYASNYSLGAYSERPADTAVIEEPEDDKQPTGPVKWSRETDIVPELKAAAQAIRDGDPTMTREKYQELVNQFKAVYPYAKLPPYANLNKIRATVYDNKKDKVGAEIPAGTIVNLRLDIPSYTTPQNPMKTAEWIPTIHIGKTAVAHQHTAVIDNPRMLMSTAEALKIASGDKDKNPFATIRGPWVPMTPKDARIEANEAMNNPEWIQVGMDPKRHTFFYDRKTQQPVLSGDRAIQVGGLVLVKNPVYDDANALKNGKPKYLFQEALKQVDDDIIKLLIGIQCA